ncbi:class I SAM-dependent methyltransferase [Alphaproteobacteria bacterium]|nr:class I SAM-dependent methyltransferase [Alphaproteobacteria bacterium]
MEKKFIQKLHNSTKRNYLERMMNEKVRCSIEAKKYSKNYWDGNRKYGYGGYRYIPGRWKEFAKSLIKLFKLKDNSKILDIGCGKGYLLKEFKNINNSFKIHGYDISKYAIINSHQDIKKNLFVHDIRKKTNFKNNYFDLTICNGVLHNLEINEIKFVLNEIERISNKNKYLMVESYNTEKELFNLQCWALTCKSFFSSDEWKWVFSEFGYKGHYEFIYFK